MSHYDVPRPRRIGRTVLIGVVAAIMLAAAVGLVYTQTRPDDSIPTPTSSPTTATPTTAPTTDIARAANGCLGGAVVDANMVLTAQQTAPLDDIGAAEFAASIVRWSGTGPTTMPPTGEVDSVLGAISGDAQLSAAIAASFDSQGASETARTGPEVTTLGGGYYIESSTADTVVVSVLLTVPEWSPSTEDIWAGSGMLTLERSSGAWLLTGTGGARTPDDLKTIMTPFVGGC